jgi:threonine 3-dehydrogenase
MVVMMRAVVKPGPGPGLQMREMPAPRPGRGEVLLQVKAASICGTDLHIRNWDPWAADRMVPPVVVGHEMCGVVVGHGDEVTGPPLGTLVSVESHVVCGTCVLCRTGKGHLCLQTRILGVHRNGVFADFVVVPEVNCWPDPPGMPLSIASLQENFGNAVHTAATPAVAGRKVLVTGCGPVGVMAIAAARALGARSVLASDVSDYRLAMARAMGAEAVFNPTQVDLEAEVMAATDGDGVDVLLEMSGVASAIDQGFRLLHPGGEAALLGLFSRPITFDFDDRIVFKGATVHGIVGRRLWATWYQMRAMLRAHAVDLSPVVTHRFALEDFAAAFDLMASGACGKVVMFPDPADADGPLTPAGR